jgi:hypothetical protein
MTLNTTKYAVGSRCAAALIKDSFSIIVAEKCPWLGTLIHFHMNYSSVIMAEKEDYFFIRRGREKERGNRMSGSE